MLELVSYVTVSGLLMIASILLGRTTNRIGVLALLAFLGLGMIAGEQGIGRIPFSDYRLSFNLGTLALLLILFDGGLNTPAKRIRQAILPAVMLATVRVFITAVLTAIGARWFGFPALQSLLLGAILSSTDAAAVFLIIRSAGRGDRLGEWAMSRFDVLYIIKRRAEAAGLPYSTCCHTFRATGIATYLQNGGTLEHAQTIANHESPRTTKLCDRTREQLTFEGVERIKI